MIYRMGKDNKYGKMEQDIKDNFLMDKNMGKVSIILINNHFIKEVSNMINLMDKDFYLFLKESIKAYFYKEIFMEMAYFVGKMVHIMKETIKMIKNMDMENMLINKEKSIKAIGRMDLDMEMVTLSIKMVKLSKVNGIMEILFDFVFFNLFLAISNEVYQNILKIDHA
jgi:hypothetical protein